MFKKLSFWGKIWKAHFKLWLKRKIKQFIESRFFLALIMLLIGIAYTVCFYELRSLGIVWETKIVIVFHREEIEVADSSAAYASSETAKTARDDGEKATSPSTSLVVHEIERIFGNDSRTALAIFKTESALNPTNKNWNCYYYDSNGKRYSDMCKPEDREKAWSMDCGVAQINVLTPGQAKECPKELFDYKNNIRVAKEMFNARGFQPWVTFKKGYYLANL